MAHFHIEHDIPNISFCKKTSKMGHFGTGEIFSTRYKDSRTKISRLHLLVWPSIALFFLIISLALTKHLTFNKVSLSLVSDCLEPSLRREWRSLNTLEKQEYLQSVQCLREKPSRFGRNQSLYDDFPWTHITTGASGACAYSALESNYRALSRILI